MRRNFSIDPFADGADDDSGSDGRRPRAYVRFDRNHETQSGPMYGPFDGLEMRQDELVGKRNSGKVEVLAVRQADGCWHLQRAREPGYLSWSVVFS